MNILNLILYSLLFIFPQQKQERLLHEDTYTQTGYGKDDNNEPIEGMMSTLYYFKIYDTKIVVTVPDFNSPTTKDIEYKYQGKDKDGNRIFSDDNHIYTYFVDENYDIMEMYTTYSMKYGKRVSTNIYWEFVQGDQSQYYNQRHKQDGSYDRPFFIDYSMPNYDYDYDFNFYY